MQHYPFCQVNVFSADPLGGNPLAVVHNADGLSDKRMAALARWTNLSETTFLLTPTHSEADYRVRIFTPNGELPFAGHPTLGSCHAWLAAGGQAQAADQIVQECDVGLVPIQKDTHRYEFAAPPLRRSGPVENAILQQIAQALGVPVSAFLHHQWVDNGPGWCAVMMDSAETVLLLEPDWTRLAPLNIGVVGRHELGHDATVEVRSFIGTGGYEDPVTGSLNAGIAQWLIGADLVSAPYTAAQGTRLERCGRVHLREAGGDIWVGGQVDTLISGEIQL